MPSPKKEIKIEPEKKQLEIENDELELQSTSLEEQAKKELTPHMIKVLKKIAYYTSKVGLTLSESCALVDIDYDKFQEEMKITPIISKVIKMKELEYKKDLMYTISQRAKSGDDKLAQWLLERRYPEEFGMKKSPGGGDGEDIFLQAFAMIRKRGDTNLINPEAGRAVVVTRSSITPEKPKELSMDARINHILNG